MTTEQKYEAVAKAIRQALPRLMEVSEGTIIKIDSIENNIQKCKIVSFDYEDKDNVIIYLKNKDEVKTLSDRELSFCEIIGKEPMLNDVLEWLNMFDKTIYILSETCLSKVFYDVDALMDENAENNCFIEDMVDIDLSKPYLKDQSEELINFLYELIK